MAHWTPLPAQQLFTYKQIFSENLLLLCLWLCDTFILSSNIHSAVTHENAVCSFCFYCCQLLAVNFQWKNCFTAEQKAQHILTPVQFFSVTLVFINMNQLHLECGNFTSTHIYIRKHADTHDCRAQQRKRQYTLRKWHWATDINRLFPMTLINTSSFFSDFEARNSQKFKNGLFGGGLWRRWKENEVRRREWK